MTDITREYLDRLDGGTWEQIGPWDVRPLIAALRRVLDQQERDEAQGAYDAAFRSAAARYGAALAGTQTERGDSFQSFGFDR